MSVRTSSVRVLTSICCWRDQHPSRTLEASLVGGPSELSYPKRMALGSFLRGMFHNWSIAHYHYLKGNLDAALWQQQLDDMAGFPNSDWSDIRWWGWDLWGFLYTPAFREVMDSVREAEREAATGG